MAERNDESATGEKEINLVDSTPKVEEVENSPQGDSKDVNICEENQVLSQEQEEEIIKKKYGGLLPKKPPLISKDNERAFFDSADWALGKVGAQKSKGPLEALRPKLEVLEQGEHVNMNTLLTESGMDPTVTLRQSNTLDRVKQQPTPHQHVRSSSLCAAADDSEDDCKSDNIIPGENQESTSDVGIECCKGCPDNQNPQN